MKIKEISIKNFSGIEDLTIKLDKLDSPIILFRFME